MQLQQLDGVRFEVSQAAIHPLGQVRPRIPVNHLLWQAPARLGCDVDRVARTFSPEAGHETLAAAVSIHIRRVDEVDARIDRRVQGGHRLLVVHGSPIAANRPGAETDP